MVTISEIKASSEFRKSSLKGKWSMTKKQLMKHFGGSVKSRSRRRRSKKSSRRGRSRRRASTRSKRSRRRVIVVDRRPRRYYIRNRSTSPFIRRNRWLAGWPRVPIFPPAAAPVAKRASWEGRNKSHVNKYGQHVKRRKNMINVGV